MFNSIGRVVSLLGIASGAFSLVMLVKQGVDFGFVAPLQTILDWYHGAILLLLGWADPIFGDLIDRLRTILKWRLELHPYWKDAAVVWGIVALPPAFNYARWALQFRSPSRAAVALGSVVMWLSNILFYGAFLDIHPRTIDPERLVAIVLATAVPVMGIVFILAGHHYNAQRAKSGHPKPNISELIPFGYRMIAIAIGGFLFVALNAGLRLAGIE